MKCFSDFQDIDLSDNPVSKELILMCNEHLKVYSLYSSWLCWIYLNTQALRESRKTTVLNEWARTRLPPQNEKSDSCMEDYTQKFLYFPVPLGHATVRDDLQCSSGECVPSCHYFNSVILYCRYLQLFPCSDYNSIPSRSSTSKPAEYNPIVYEYTVHAHAESPSSYGITQWWAYQSSCTVYSSNRTRGYR